MAQTEVAFLGPLGTYSHLVAEKYYGRNVRMVPLPTVLDVCTYVARNSSRRGIVPIENSSGGAIYETVDILLAGTPRVHILEELSLDVQLALLGHEGRAIKTLYSHAMPLEHCAGWIRKHLPRVRKEVSTSTAVAALQAIVDPHSAALCSRKLARMYNLDVLEYPVSADVPNITMFYAIGGKKQTAANAAKSTLAVKLLNRPGSLCTLLDTFRSETVNLSRLISRPIRGCPREYTFLVDVEGHPGAANMKRALAAARRASAELRPVGSYPCRRPYRS